MVEKLESFTRKLELFESDISTGRLLHCSTLKSQGQVTELMLDFIKQLRANFTSRFEDYSIPKDIIAFVRDPLTVRPSGDFTSQAKQMIPSLDEAALEMELIDFQTSSLVSDALRSAESVSAFGVGSSEEYSTIKRLTLDPLPPTDLVLVGQALPLSCDPELWSESEDEDLTPISPPTQLTFLEREHTLRSPLMPPQKLLLTRVLITPEDLQSVGSDRTSKQPLGGSLEKTCWVYHRGIGT
ncbi:hypothetical protein NQZ68_013015 [Dissostichus eleginoides]|nr:hypothetical protein NQZ68_013015 [Dissostichus eleginoides]